MISNSRAVVATEDRDFVPPLFPDGGVEGVNRESEKRAKRGLGVGGEKTVHRTFLCPMIKVNNTSIPSCYLSMKEH